MTRNILVGMKKACTSGWAVDKRALQKDPGFFVMNAPVQKPSDLSKKHCNENPTVMPSCWRKKMCARECFWKSLLWRIRRHHKIHRGVESKVWGWDERGDFLLENKLNNILHFTSARLVLHKNNRKILWFQKIQSLLERAMLYSVFFFRVLTGMAWSRVQPGQVKPLPYRFWQKAFPKPVYQYLQPI